MACRKSFVCTVVALIMVLFSSTASAEGEVAPPSPADYAAALAAARQPEAISFAKTNFRQVHGTDPTTLTLSERGVATYVLNPDFVRGVPGAPAGVLQYIAVTATDEKGESATLRAMPEPTGQWSVGSVFSGNDEEDLSTHLPPGAVLMNEPQINGWYEWTPDGVKLLRASLPQSPVGALVPLADYQKQVKSRYGDKLPGSDYEKNQGIGFTVQDPNDAIAHGPSTVVIVVAVAGGVIVIAAVTMVVVRRRRATRTEDPDEAEQALSLQPGAVTSPGQH
ncbi:hypothetical protein [Actinokineospora enzanensis]|uniref:hypothetical protein n=1 Tax=Actinokineospora enzanensis TaxID=155975 RepID=UPI001B7FAE59|nr:hypothetical protein [Actinokineospora enzanensis]